MALRQPDWSAAAFSSRPSTLERVLALRGPFTFLIAMSPGLALVVGSIVLDLHDFTAPAESPYVPTDEGQPAMARQIGYLAAPNWSVTYLLLTPLAIYLMLEVLHGLRCALEALNERGMVRSESMKPTSGHTLAAAWLEETPLRRMMLIAFAAVVPATYSLVEWFRNNFLRLFELGGPKAGPADYDWGLRALIEHGSWWDRLSNAGFDLLAFCSEGVLLACVIGFFLVCLDLGRAIERAPRLVPDLRSDHERRGFEDLEEPLQLLLLVALVTYLMCYFIRIEGVYMASPGFKSLGDFVSRDIVAGATAAAHDKEWKAAFAKLFEVVPSANRQSFMAFAAAFLVLTFTGMLVVMTAGRAARRARREACRYYEASGDDAPTLFGLERKDELERLKSMNVWPLSYLDLHLLSLLTVMAMVTLWYYRIGLFMFAFVVVVVAAGLVKRLSKAV